MARKTDISQYALIPAILAFAGAAFVLKPEELRRNPLLEAKGVIGMAAIYEVMYARCVESNLSEHSAGGGAYAFRFPAHSDKDAARFVSSARPQCDIASLYRLDRTPADAANSRKFARTRIEI
ncbi:MAG: hypothetical protein AAFW68_12135 [Pseudomonadota bacterium]